MEIIRNFAQPSVEQLQLLFDLSYRGAPSFLGNFGIQSYGLPYGRGRKFPDALCDLARLVSETTPDQTFNAGFLQRYSVGQAVRRHRDPRNNVGHTLILVLGSFTGAESSVWDHQGEHKVRLEQGDLLRLPCTINGVQGPPHAVSEVLSGERFALILNTITS